MNKFRNKDSTIIRRLELWAIEYYYLCKEQKKISISLANKGCVAKPEAISVTPTDSFEIAGQKEKLKTVSKKLNNLKKIFSSIGAKVLDNETLEIVFPGGPKGTYYSWQPGETALSYWKNDKTKIVPRNYITGAPKPTYH